MSYELHAVIAGGEMLRGASRGMAATRPASIGQGLALIPMTDALSDSFAAAAAADDDADGVGIPGFWRLTEGCGKTLADWSAAGPVAYVEAEYFGGVGEQQAAVWDGGALVLGPLHAQEGRAFPPAGSPISQALRRLGVVAGAGEDEFSAVGLDRHRDGRAWIA
ncbi:hypothetical protein [Streptomyces lydicus]|uniref:hypothetical protein n=1 Tax=Streptomyces lydicus TaxID=47763 RepID=UPI001012F78D|nr:hypothetical protein [Streptomyces lydicus]MCZ1009547.1 hypothetical protein [Streptomyces lydicus]